MKQFLRSIAIATLVTAAAFAFAVYATRAAEPAKTMTIREALLVLTGLRNLDGHMIVVKQGAQDNTVMTPWEFHNGRLRQRISNDEVILEAVEKSTEAARVAILREILKKMPPGTSRLDAGSPEQVEFQRQYDDVLGQPAPGAQDVSRIKVSELDLDKNEIAPTVLTALRPILDVDVQ